MNFFALDSNHIICYVGLAICFLVAWQLGNEMNPKPKAKNAAADTNVNQQKRS